MEVEVTELPSFEGRVMSAEPYAKKAGACYLRFVGLKEVFSVFVNSGYSPQLVGKRVRLSCTVGRYGLTADTVEVIYDREPAA